MVGAERVSFAGSLAAARRYSEALMQARSEARRRQLHEVCKAVGRTILSLAEADPDMMFSAETLSLARRAAGIE